MKKLISWVLVAVLAGICSVSVFAGPITDVAKVEDIVVNRLNEEMIDDVLRVAELEALQRYNTSTASAMDDFYSAVIKLAEAEKKNKNIKAYEKKVEQEAVKLSKSLAKAEQEFADDMMVVSDKTSDGMKKMLVKIDQEVDKKVVGKGGVNPEKEGNNSNVTTVR